jgi:uncharacterized protein (DUF2249 family)
MSKRELDVSMLEPPEPMQQIIDAIGTLMPGEYLKVLHHREPFPLYPILGKEGFSYYACHGKEIPYEIYIWRCIDAEANELVQSEIDSKM